MQVQCVYVAGSWLTYLMFRLHIPIEHDLLCLYFVGYLEIGFFRDMYSDPVVSFGYGTQQVCGVGGQVNEELRSELIEMEKRDRALRAELVGRGALHGPGYHP